METGILPAKKRGPKAKGVKKVVYYRRVLPEVVQRMDEALGLAEAAGLPSTPVHHGDHAGVLIEGQSALDELKRQLKLVLEDNEKMAVENAALQAKIKVVARMSNDEKFNNLLFQYDKLKAHIKKLEDEKA